MAPYNALIYLFSRVPNTPILKNENFPEMEKLTANWQEIRDEARRLYDGGHIQMSKTYNDLAFNTFFKRGWKRFYLKWYGDFFPSAMDLCPKTVDLVKSIPSVNAALFTLMPGKSASVDLQIDFGHALSAVDFDSLDFENGHLELNEGDFEIISFRKKLIESFKPLNGGSGGPGPTH